ncbi:Uncharacterized protein APZ42_027536 [Daphnia magna]|uniref:Uncharacterized protein n=1 Tax=Daphnia magna TaxID=35525 RepID=A0A164R9W8_9CRUS|nr:Uncharacterized protein APZ42_027536 [Daphnia magna]
MQDKCRLCDSPTHVLANCPKQPRSLTTPSTILKGPMGTRSYSSVLTNRGTLKIVRKLQETGVTSGGKMPIAPTVDADSFPELAQLSTISTVVVFDKAPEDPISKPDEAEFISDTDADAEDTSCVDSRGNSVTNKNNKKKRSRTASSHSPVEEAEEIESDVACLVELGSPTREVSVTIPGVDTNCVSETLESLGVPLSTPSTSIPDKTLKAMEVVRMKKGNGNKTQSPKHNFKF